MPQSRRHEDGSKRDPGSDNRDRDAQKVWEGPSGPAPATPSLTSAYSALLRPLTSANKRASITNRRLSCGSPPIDGARATRRLWPRPQAGLSRGQAPPSFITAQWKPLPLLGGGRAGANPAWLLAAMSASGGRSF
ncbi:hypothetical protein NN561_002358 [Cricetulus griseus]